MKMKMKTGIEPEIEIARELQMDYHAPVASALQNSRKPGSIDCGY
jgi:hypothetical protein